jgi:hypothetical protein
VTDWTIDPQSKALIELFVSHSSEVMTGPGGPKLVCGGLGWPAKDYDSLSQRSPFRDVFKKLLHIRIHVDRIADTYSGDTDEQCNVAQTLLKHFRGRNAMRDLYLARRMIEATLAPAWAPRQNLRFAQVGDFFEQYRDYFLSYTNKRADDVNYRYRNTFDYDVQALFEQYKQTANLLARQTVTHFSGLYGYYDKNEILGGDEVRAAIVKGANSALVLVQLLTRPLLDPTYEEFENYCFQEYTAYTEGDDTTPEFVRKRDRKYRFLLAESTDQERKKPAEVLKPLAEVQDAYAGWFQEMLDRHVDVLDCNSREGLKSQLEEIGRQIDSVRRDVLNVVVPLDYVAVLFAQPQKRNENAGENG